MTRLTHLSLDRICLERFLIHKVFPDVVLVVFPHPLSLCIMLVCEFLSISFSHFCSLCPHNSGFSFGLMGINFSGFYFYSCCHISFGLIVFLWPYPFHFFLLESSTFRLFESISSLICTLFFIVITVVGYPTLFFSYNTHSPSENNCV